MSQRIDTVSFVGLSLAYGYYAWDVAMTGIDQPGLLGRTIGFYLFVAIAMAILVGLTSLLPFKPPVDRELEREVGRWAGRNAYVAGFAVVWAIPFAASVPGLGVNLAILLSVAAMALAEVVRFGSKVIYRGLGAARNQRALAL